MSYNDQTNSGAIIALFRSFDAGIRLLWSKKWILIACTIIGGVIGVSIAWFDTPKYESHLTFALDDDNGGMSAAMSLAAEFGLSLGSSNNIFEGDNIITLLTSRTIVEKTLLSIDSGNGKIRSMADYYIAINNQNGSFYKEIARGPVSFPVNLQRSKFTYQQDSALYNLYKRIVVQGELKASKPDKKLNRYEVIFTSPDERFTKVFTDRLIFEATGFYSELKSKRTREIMGILERRVEQTRLNLNSSITSRAAMQDADLNPAFQEAQAQLQKKQVDISAYGGAYGELYKNLEIARYQYLKSVPLLQVIDGAEYPMKRVKKSRLFTGLSYAVFFGCMAVLVIVLIHFITLAKHYPVKKKHSIAAT